MNNRKDIPSLRDALEYLKSQLGQLVETDVEVDPRAELSGVYRHVGAGGTVMRPTRVDGPARVFHNVKGHPKASVAIGLMASRERVARLFGCKEEELAHRIGTGYADNLLLRAADVCLKEGRKVVLCPRKMPLGKVHLRNLSLAADLGGSIVPPMLSFYSGQRTEEDQFHHVVGKLLMQLDLGYSHFREWKGTLL